VKLEVRRIVTGSFRAQFSRIQLSFLQGLLSPARRSRENVRSAARYGMEAAERAPETVNIRTDNEQILSVFLANARQEPAAGRGLHS
jgi:hypothetical protein